MQHWWLRESREVLGIFKEADKLWIQPIFLLHFFILQLNICLMQFFIEFLRKVWSKVNKWLAAQLKGFKNAHQSCRTNKLINVSRERWKTKRRNRLRSDCGMNEIVARRIFIGNSCWIGRKKVQGHVLGGSPRLITSVVIEAAESVRR